MGIEFILSSLTLIVIVLSIEIYHLHWRLNYAKQELETVKDFEECDSCAGCPYLCCSCQSNRVSISIAKDVIDILDY